MEQTPDGYFDPPPVEKQSDDKMGRTTATAPTTAATTVRSEDKVATTARSEDKLNKVVQNSNRKKKKLAKKEKKVVREKMTDGEMIKSEQYLWKVSKLLGSGGFGDVYKVKKEKNEDKKEYAMKTEMVAGDKRMLRLKIEVSVLKMCHEVENKQHKKHFVEFVDRGITDKFKFLVMGLVGPSLEDIRKAYLLKNYSKNTAMQSALQTLQSVRDLHDIGWIHRDIKPANFAVGLEGTEDVIYMLDFGIARSIFKSNTREIKNPRTKVKFLGTIRFASRACHLGKEQGRRDDLETWLYMVFDLFDEEYGLPWKRAADKTQVIQIKEKFFKHEFPKCYKNVPKDVQKVVEYIDSLTYADEPDYGHVRDTLLAISKDQHISVDKKFDWIGKLKKKNEFEEIDNKPRFSSTSSDNQQSGSESSTSSKKRKPRKKSSSTNQARDASKKTKGKK